MNNSISISSISLTSDSTRFVCNFSKSDDDSDDYSNDKNNNNSDLCDERIRARERTTVMLATDDNDAGDSRA